MNPTSKKTERLILLLFVSVIAVILLFVTGIIHLPPPAKPPIKYGFINTQGSAVTPFEFDSVGDFHQGLATVAKDGQVYVIDRKGKKVDTQPFSFRKDTISIVHIMRSHSVEEFSRLNRAFFLVCPPSYGKGLYRIRRACHHKKETPEQGSFDFVYHFVDLKGGENNRIMYEEAYPYSDSLALVRNETDKKGLREWQRHNWGYIGLDAKYRIRPLYADAHSFSEGLAGVGILIKHHGN